MYEAVIEPRPYGYMVVDVAGGGYAKPGVVGEIWPAPGYFTFEWNMFDIEGCDGQPETLPDGTAMMLCGVGKGVADGQGNISASLNGQVMTGAPRSTLALACFGSHQLVFTRVP